MQTDNNQAAFGLLRKQFPDVRPEDGALRVYDAEDTEQIAECLLRHGIGIRTLRKNRIGLEEYYIELMSQKEAG